MTRYAVWCALAALLTVGCKKSEKDTADKPRPGPAATEAKPAEPKPAEPKPAELKPAEPKVVEPKPATPPAPPVKSAKASPKSPSGGLSLIPETALAAITIGDLPGLRRKGIDLERKLQVPGGPKVSALFSEALKWVGLEEGPKMGPVGLAFLEGKTGLVAVAARYETIEAATAACGAKPGELTPGKAVKRDGRVVLLRGTTVWIARKFLFGAPSPAELERATAGPSIVSTLSPERRARFAGADVGVMIPRAGLALAQKSFGPGKKPGHDDLTEKELRGAIAAAELVVATLHVRADHVQLRGTVFFREDPLVGKLLETLRGGDGAAELTGLPPGPVLAAFAARGDGSKNMALIRRLTLWGSDNFGVGKPPAWMEGFMTAWGTLRGSRAALYPDAKDKPEATAVFILDVPGAQAAIPGLAKASGGALKQATGTVLGGLPVHELTLPPDERGPKALLGERWNVVTLVARGDQVVAIMGRNTSLLEKTLKNVTAGSAGLQADKGLTDAQRMDPAAKVEAHINATALLRPSEAPPVPLSSELTAVGLTIEKRRVQLDMFVPLADVRTVLFAL